MPTNTSVDKPWNALRDYMKLYSSRTKETFQNCKKRCYVPIMEFVHSDENQLKVIVEAARDCEQRTAQTKCEVEFSNKNLNKYTKMLSDEEKKRGEQLNARRLQTMIDAVQAKDKSRIEVWSFLLLLFLLYFFGLFWWIWCGHVLRVYIV